MLDFEDILYVALRVPAILSSIVFLIIWLFIWLIYYVRIPIFKRIGYLIVQICDIFGSFFF